MAVVDTFLLKKAYLSGQIKHPLSITLLLFVLF